MRFTFPKKEKLKSLKAFTALFAGADSAKHYPLRAVYKRWPTDGVPIQAGFSVSKKRFKKAVDRNRIKRLMKEAYRLQKPFFEKQLKHEYAIVFIYLHHHEIGLPQMMQTMQHCLRSLQNFDAATQKED